MSDEQVDKVLEWMGENARPAAQARAERLYKEEYLPSLRARIAAECLEAGDSASAADIKAKASEAYQTALKEYRTAVEEDEFMRSVRTRGEAIIEVWRSGQANRRAMERVQ